jgi:hypothetical protein
MVHFWKNSEGIMNIEHDILHLEESKDSLIEKKIALQISLLLLSKRSFIKKYKLRKELEVLNTKINKLNSKLDKLQFYQEVGITINYIFETIFKKRDNYD